MSVPSSFILFVPRGSREASGTYSILPPGWLSTFSPSPYSLHRTKVTYLPMTLQNALQQLYRLDRSSPEFRDQLSNVINEEGYAQWVPSIQSDDLVWLIDHLDKVRHRCLNFSLPAQTVVGSRYSRPCRSHFPEVSARAQVYMWRPNNTANILYAFVSAFGCRPSARRLGRLR